MTTYDIPYPSGNQPAQDRFLRDLAAGWTLYQGGWGSGKTWAAARKLLWLHAYNQCPSLVVAPTYGDLSRTVVPALVDACDAFGWSFKQERSTNPKLIVHGQPILLMSAEHPERFAGFQVGAIYVDEAARIRSSMDDPLRDAPTQIRSRLRHPKAKILHGMAATTPEGLDSWIQRDFFEKTLPGYRSYIGNTLSNKALTPEYLAAQMAALPPELAEQYLAGRAVSYIASRAHPYFSRTRNVRVMEWDPRLPVHVGCDYNVSPMAWIAIQEVGDELRVLDEVVIPDNAQVDMAIHAAHARGWGKFFIHFHPDKSAKARSTVGDSEFFVMQETARALGWNFTGNAYGSNPSVAQRIANVSRLIYDATGRTRLYLHPRATWLATDLERTARASNGYDPGNEGKRGHSLDALGYACWDLAEPRGKAGTSDILN